MTDSELAADFVVVAAAAGMQSSSNLESMLSFASSCWLPSGAEAASASCSCGAVCVQIDDAAFQYELNLRSNFDLDLYRSLNFVAWPVVVVVAAVAVEQLGCFALTVDAVRCSI